MDPPTAFITQPCYLLTLLPLELRRQIYAYFVIFSAPIKLRQVIPGSRDLPILRTCRQVYAEAREVLFEGNTVVVTRNDFCTHTDPLLQTPLSLPHIRHLHLSSFSTSIACTLRAPLLSRCAVCQPSASGLFAVLREEMPRLRSVTVDFTRHAAELRRLGEGIWEEEEVVVDERGREVRVLREGVVRVGVRVRVLCLPGVLEGR